MTENPIQHIVVLMLENRSFDHMLGYLDHEDPRVGTLRHTPGSCPVTAAKPDGERVATSDDAHHRLGVDPAHSHDQVKLQVYGRKVVGADAPMSGFVESYATKVGKRGDADGRDIMRCFHPSELPVLATLAKQFAVFTRWHASVPGETWPNRNFAHAGTSDGTVDIKKRWYNNDTVFQRLDEAEQSWNVFHDGIPQVWVFQKVWRHSPGRFKATRHLLEAIKRDRLPAYAFVEPDHGYGVGDGNSQHPTNNRHSGRSFEDGETLIGSIYNALHQNPAVFEKTLFLITYDEHGGFYDHIEPIPVTPPNGRRGQRGQADFEFSTSGVRVPAVAVNPHIAAGTVVTEPLEHSSIPRTVRTRFAPSTGRLSAREDVAKDVIELLELSAEPRTDCEPLVLTPVPLGITAQSPQTINDFEASLLDLAAAVQNLRLQDASLTPASAEDPPFVTTGPMATAAARRTVAPGSEAASEIHDLVAAFHQTPDENVPSEEPDSPGEIE